MAIDITSVVTAAGALGIASFALVDATKIGRQGGISNSGFSRIQAAVNEFYPGVTRESLPGDANSASRMLDILHGNWINGMPLADQKAIAKSLIKLRLSKDTAAAFAEATGVDAVVLAATADSMNNGTELSLPQNNVLGRFDLGLTAILDAGYQRADQKYRNNSRVLASGVAVVLAVLGGWSVAEAAYFGSVLMWQSVLCGLLAIPLAPISKDLASALTAGVRVAQSLKK